MSFLRQQLLNLISAPPDGVLNQSVCGLLFALSLVYRFVIRVRNWGYDSGLFGVTKIDAAVLSMGNVTVGGTGKTPHVIWLARRLGEHRALAIVSRGYKSAKANQLNDEGLEIAQRLPAIVQVQNSDRIAAAREAIATMGRLPDRLPVLLLDDGFQHRRLARDLDIVLFDALQPFGFGQLLPRGLLREDLSAVRRADVAITTRANLVSATDRAKIAEQLREINPGICLAETELVAGRWIDAKGNDYPLDTLKQQRVLAFCGIGNPENFRQTLRRITVELVDLIPFSDHQTYGETELARIANRAIEKDCDAVVCTHKDLVKLTLLPPIGIPLFALLTEVRFLSGEAELLQRVERAIGSKSQSSAPQVRARA